jgi:LuxR family maltose regulon positive regulatory protein
MSETEDPIAAPDREQPTLLRDAMEHMLFPGDMAKQIRRTTSAKGGIPRMHRATGADVGRLGLPRRRGRLCERRELLDSLDETLNTRVTLIVAPAGYGKTTLLSQWCERLEEKQIPVTYYSAAERDRDPAMFLAMIAAALVQAGVEIAGPPPIEDGRIRDDLSLDDILLGLELAGQHIMLIIDDFERINEPAVTELMATFLDTAPATVHLLIASRTFPAIPLSTIQIEGQLRLIDSFQLKLRHEELAWMLDLDVDTPEVREIAAQTQGWPVTAELYRLWRERHQAHDGRATFGGHVAEVHNYLAEQLFSSLPPEQFELLVDIADREEVQPELVDAMRGRQDSARLLGDIHRAMSSLMWMGRDGASTAYRLHPLLLDHLRQTLSEDNQRRSRLSVNAALWFLDHQRHPEAIRAALEAKDPATVQHIIQSLRPMHILVADSATALRMILRELPEEVIARHPRIQIMAVLAHFKAGFFAESRMMLDRIRAATGDFRIDPDGHADWLTSEGNLVDLIITLQVSRWSPRIDEMCDIALAAAADDPTVWGSCEVVQMLAQQLRGNFDAADAAILRARGIYDAIELSRYGHTQIVGHEMLVLIARGRLRKAVEAIANYQKQPGLEVPDDVSTPTLLKLLLAAIRYEQEFSDSAVEALKNSLAEHSKVESWIDQYAIAYPIIATRLFVREGAEAADTFLAEARSRAQRVGLEALPHFVRFLQIEYLARGNRVAEALHMAGEIGVDRIARGEDDLADQRSWRERDAAVRAHIRLCIADGRPDEALESARWMAKAGLNGGRLHSEIKGLVFSAMILAARQEPGQASADLLRAILLAYPEGFVAPFAEEGEELMPLVRALLADAEMDAYARRHLDEVRRAIASAMARTDSNQLNAREREIVRHLAEGLSNKVIARRMGITDHTVKFHLKKVFSKLEVSSRRAAVAKVQAGSPQRL